MAGSGGQAGRQRQTAMAKWRLYAGAAHTSQAIATMMTPRARWLDYLLRRVHFASLVALKHSAAAPPLLPSTSPSPNSLATTSLSPLASHELHRLPPYRLDVFAGPNELR